MPSIPGVLDPLTIRITQLPSATVVENDWRSFTVDIGSAIVTVTVRPRIWNNLVERTKQYRNWSAIITGRMGELTDVGFVLEQPGIQIFEAPSELVD